MSRTSTSFSGGGKKDVDGRDKPGHDAFDVSYSSGSVVNSSG
jgi:hypothetical protein